MPAFKTRPGQGKISNFGYDFDEVDGTEVDEGDIAERLRNHFQFEEVVGAVSREAMPAPVAIDEPAQEQATPGGEIKRKPGRQPYPRDEAGNIIKPVKTDG
jgi:hypothetical protein